MRRHLTALFVVFHLAAVGVLSIPAPPPGLRGDHRNRDTDEALAAWADAVASLGLPRQGVEETLRTVLPMWGRLLSAVKGPFVPYAEATGAEQSWRMFGMVPDKVARFEVDVSVDGDWEPLYRPQSRTHAFKRRLLRQERMRAAINPFSNRNHRGAFRALADHLGSDRSWTGEALRVQMRRLTIPDPFVLRQTGELLDQGTYWTEVRSR